MKDIRIISYQIEEAINKLSDCNNPKLDAEILLAHILQITRINLKKEKQQQLTLTQIENYQQLIIQRSKNIPIAYILGYKEWCDMKIIVTTDVLIPRDETEILCNYIYSEKRLKKPKTILDIGTGSGNIVCFFGIRFLTTKILAIDISSLAINIAKKNYYNICPNSDIIFKKSDLLLQLTTKQHYDLIIANLPYVPIDTIVSKDIRYEPEEAIFTKNNGLFLIQELEKQIIEKQITFNELWLEFLPHQVTEISKIFKEYKIKFFPDISGEIFFAKIY